MPNGEVRPTRPSPYWRHASPPRRTTTLKSDFTPEQASNRIGQHLLRTLVQSLPSGAEPTRSRSSCPPTSRRRRQVSGCRSMGTPESPLRTKAPVRLQAGMPVQQVLERDRPHPKVIGLGRNGQHSMMTHLKRRSESPTAKAKAREEEFDRIPEMVTGTATAKAREEEFEKIPSKISSINQEVKEAEDESQKNVEPEIVENPEPEAPQNSKPNSLDNLSKNSPESENTKTAEDQPEEPEISAKEPPEPQKPASVANSKIIPCFRGEYPTRHRPDSFQWFKAAVPNCGNIVTICDEEQQVMGEAEIVTACEVTEAHFLSIDDGSSVPVPRCNKCSGYPQHNQNGNWFGSNFGQQPCFQQQQPCFQQQQPCFQQQQPCFQQQQPCFQQQQRNCGRNSLCSKAMAKPRSCLKSQDQNQSRNSIVYSQKQQMQQAILPQIHQTIQQMTPSEQVQPAMQQQPVQQEPIEETNYCLTEMLAEELKKQMLAAQAQIAQVQLQLNSACGATRVRQMHVLTQNANEAPSWAPETQFLGSLEDIHADGDDAPPDEVRENGEEDAHIGQEFSMQLDQQTLPSHFNCSTLGSMESNKMWPGVSAPQPSQQAMQLGMYPVPVAMPNQVSYFQSDPQPFPCQQQQPPSFMPQQMIPCQQQHQQMIPCQQQQQQMIPCQQIPQMSPCQQQYRAPPFPPQKPPPCQQKQQRLSCQQQQQQQQQQTMRSGQQSQSNKCSHAPQFCPSCCCQRYAQMRFMMPRCWPR